MIMNNLCNLCKFFARCVRCKQEIQQQLKLKEENFFQVAWKKECESMSIVVVLVDPFQLSEFHDKNRRLRILSKCLSRL